MKFKIAIYTMISVQMIAWAFHQYHGGTLDTKSYVYFCAGMMVGQCGATVECFRSKAWGTLIVQLYFFFFTGLGMLKKLSG